MPVRPMTAQDICREAIRRGLDDGYVGRERLRAKDPAWQRLYEQGYEWGQANQVWADNMIAAIFAVREGVG